VTLFIQDEVKGWRKLHNEFRKFNFSIGIRWAKNVARMEEMHTRYLSENLKGRDHLDRGGFL